MTAAAVDDYLEHFAFANLPRTPALLILSTNGRKGFTVALATPFAKASQSRHKVQSKYGLLRRRSRRMPSERKERGAMQKVHSSLPVCRDGIQVFALFGSPSSARPDLPIQNSEEQML